jgi:hypothetical protein
MEHLDDGSAPPDDQGFRIALAFVGFALLAAVLFTLYLLLWDGGGTMS